MQKGHYLQAILWSPKTVFSARDIALLWGEQLSQATRVRLAYYVRRGDLYRIRKGLYAKDRNYLWAFDRKIWDCICYNPPYILGRLLPRELLISGFRVQVPGRSPKCRGKRPR